MPSQLVSLFKEQLENEAQDLAAIHELTRRGDFLIWWYFLRLVVLEEAEVGEIVCDGPNDLGIDAIWIDDEQYVHFYQFKNPYDIEQNFPSGEVDKVLGGLNLILSRRHDEIANASLRGRVEEVYQTIPAGYRLHLVSSGAGVTKDARTKLDAFVEGLGTPSEGFFVWDDQDITWLQDAFYKATLPTCEEPIELELDKDPYAVRAGSHEFFMFQLPGRRIGELYDIHGEALLQRNIRVYQGDRMTNARIYETAIGDEAHNFLHYNNGVAFLCERGDWDPFTRRLVLHDTQIVNGGQTVRVLHRAFAQGRLGADVTVPVRVITSLGDKQFANSVTVNLNNQNRISPSFLRSNDPRVIQLAHSLASIGWHLERREGEVRSLTDDDKQEIEQRIGESLSNRVIHLKEGTQAYVSTYMGLPELAKKDPKKMFESEHDGGRFEDIFSSEMTAEKLVAAQRLARAIGRHVKQFASIKRRKDKLEDRAERYSTLLGEQMVGSFGTDIEEMIPQSAVFLTALVFAQEVRIRGRGIDDVIEEIDGGNAAVINDMLYSILSFQQGDDRWSKAWPTLLKSQAFFNALVEQVISAAA